MNFLKDYVREDTIDKLKDTYSKDALYNFICNDKNVIKVIEYLKSINIKDIDGIMINNINVFMRDVDEVKGMLGKYKQDELSYFINQDINNLELIWD